MTNPLTASWTGPYGGIPPFDKVRVEHFEPGLESAMQERLAEIEAIANDSAPPTFGNTLAAWIWIPIALLLFWRHRANIRQLLSGKERSIGR